MIHCWIYHCPQTYVAAVCTVTPVLVREHSWAEALPHFPVRSYSAKWWQLYLQAWEHGINTNPAEFVRILPYLISTWFRFPFRMIDNSTCSAQVYKPCDYFPLSSSSLSPVLLKTPSYEVWPQCEGLYLSLKICPHDEGSHKHEGEKWLDMPFKGLVWNISWSQF